MSHSENQYLGLLRDALEHGRIKLGERTGTGTIGVFGTQTRYNLSEGYPLLTTKFMNFNYIKAELLWFLSGSTNALDLQALGCPIWDDWMLQEDVVMDGHLVAARGELGAGIYSAMWRNWPTPSGEKIDQISRLIHDLKHNPSSRRHIVSGWNPDLIPDEGASHERNIINGKAVLPPCHTLFQFAAEEATDAEIDAYLATHEGATAPKYRLSCHLYARSQDLPVGTPYNIASYALLTTMIAQVCGMIPGDYVHSTGDTHIYLNQTEGVKTQLSRTPTALPTLKLNPAITDIFSFTMDDIELVDYNPQPFIKFAVAK